MRETIFSRSSITRRRYIFFAAIVVAVFVGPFLFGYHTHEVRHSSTDTYNNRLSSISKSARQTTKAFHLLLPATGPNVHFCKLLLSASLLGYPEPIFIGWDGRGIYNGTQSHLFKITETLAYLRGLPDSADQDMMLILDAYDVWLQLRPSTLLTRYYTAIAKNDARVQEEGILEQFHAGHEIRNTIVFGPDKIHFPQGEREPAVWAVPESTLPRSAFGPETDTNMFGMRPKWLNSGTIMGPVKEMRDMFAATVDMMSRKYDPEYKHKNSDQYYFAEVWGEQEFNRGKLRDGRSYKIPSDGNFPDLPEEKRTEFGICLDYETDLFQTAAAFDRHLTWMRFNGSAPPEVEGPIGDQNRNHTEEDKPNGARIDKWKLPADIMQSEAPFSALPKDFPDRLGWDEVMLGMNPVVATAFPLYHMTGDKTIRDRWWPRMWFHPHAEKLQVAAKRLQAARKDPSVFLTMDGVTWKQASPDGRKPPHGIGPDKKGGAWVDDGRYVPWAQMCTGFDQELYALPPTEDGKERS